MGSAVASIRLSDPTLLRQANYIDGKWVHSDSGAALAVRNPATGDVVGEIPAMGVAETRRANMPGGGAPSRFSPMVPRRRRSSDASPRPISASHTRSRATSVGMGHDEKRSLTHS
jgi:hypothetical protein